VQFQNSLGELTGDGGQDEGCGM